MPENDAKPESRTSVAADLTALQGELTELSKRIRRSSDSQRGRAKELGQPCIVIRGK